MGKKIKIAIADDHTLFRQGLSLLIKQFNEFELVLEAVNGRELLKKVKENMVDVVLMDLKMPGMDGLTTTMKLRKIYPNIKIIAVTMYDEKKFILEMLKNGANGYLFKNVEAKELSEAIHAVIEKDFYFNQYVTEAMMKGRVNKRRSKSAVGKNNMLSKRERQVLKMICRQHTTAEIANQLYLSTRTVENYRHRLLDKLQVRNSAGLVIYAIENGMINVDLTRDGSW